MNINIKELETLRDETEIQTYFLSKNINITNEEIYKLKESYDKKTKSNCNKLSYEQLDNVAGGILYIFDKKVYSTLRDKKPDAMPEHVWKVAQDLMSMQLDTYQNAVKFAYEQGIHHTPNYQYTVLIPPVLEIYRDGSDYKLHFRRVGCDRYDNVKTHLNGYAAEHYPGKNWGLFPSMHLNNLAQKAHDSLHQNPSDVLNQLKETRYYDASSPEAFELWQVTAANAGMCEGNSIGAYPGCFAELPCFVHKVSKKGTFEAYYADKIRELFTDEHITEAYNAGYVGNCLGGNSIYGKFAYKSLSLTPESYMQHIPHDEMPAPDREFSLDLNPNPTQTYRFHILSDKESQTNRARPQQLELPVKQQQPAISLEPVKIPLNKQETTTTTTTITSDEDSPATNSPQDPTAETAKKETQPNSDGNWFSEHVVKPDEETPLLRPVPMYNSYESPF